MVAHDIKPCFLLPRSSNAVHPRLSRSPRTSPLIPSLGAVPVLHLSEDRSCVLLPYCCLSFLSPRVQSVSKASLVSPRSSAIPIQHTNPLSERRLRHELEAGTDTHGRPWQPATLSTWQLSTSIEPFGACLFCKSSCWLRPSPPATMPPKLTSKSVTCPICQKSFSRTDHLKRHHLRRKALPRISGRSRWAMLTRMPF